MAGQTGIAANPLLALLPPDQQQTYAQLQQRQAIGQALLQQGLQPMDAGTNAVGGMAYHVSPLNGVSKLLNTYLGNKLSMDAMGQQAQLQGRALSGAFGGTPQTAPAATQPDAGGIAGGGSGDGVQSYPVATGGQPTGQQLGAAMLGAPAAQSSNGGGPLTLPGYTPQQSVQLYATLGPEAYGKLLESRTAPTDATRMAWAAGIDPRGANVGALAKANYIPPNQGAPGTVARDPLTNQPMYYSPSIPEGGEPVFNAGGQVVGVKALDGSIKLIGDVAAAKTGGEGSQLPYAGVDASGNPLPVTNRTAAATGNVGGGLPPLPPQGAVGTPGGADTPPLPGGAVPGGRRALYAAAPLGATTAAEASQTAPSKQMAASQGALADSDNSYQASRQALLKMISITQNGRMGDSVARFLPDGAATRINNDAAEYQKAHANFISLQGKALGEGGTNQSRATLDDSVPTFDKPADAKLSGLNDQLNQLDWNHVKRQTLNPVYQQGNEKAYTQQSAAFDQTIKPSTMPTISPILQMSGAQQQSAVQAAVKANPSLRPSFELLFNAGLLK